MSNRKYENDNKQKIKRTNFSRWRRKATIPTKGTLLRPNPNQNHRRSGARKQLLAAAGALKGQSSAGEVRPRVCRLAEQSICRAEKGKFIAGQSKRNEGTGTNFITAQTKIRQNTSTPHRNAEIPTFTFQNFYLGIKYSQERKDFFPSLLAQALKFKRNFQSFGEFIGI